jgi:hypothetical protein
MLASASGSLSVTQRSLSTPNPTPNPNPNPNLVAATAGLVLALYPHQRAAVRWMLQRERSPQRLPQHPHVRCLRTAAGLPFTACLATGAVATHADCHAGGEAFAAAAAAFPDR